jgi:WD40-like Beta Propeller Repeat
MTTKSSLLTLLMLATATLVLAGLAMTARAAAATVGAVPSHAPSGLIAFVDNRAVDSGGEIYSVAAAGGSSRDISNNPAPDSDPVVSPNGRRIAFFETRDATTSLYAVGTHGAERRRSIVYRGNSVLAEQIGGAA